MKRVLPLLLFLITGCGGGSAVSPGGQIDLAPAPETARVAPLGPDVRVHVSLDPSTRPPLVLAVGEWGCIDERYTYRYTSAVEKVIYSSQRVETTLEEQRIGLGILLGIDEVRTKGSGLAVDLLVEWTAMPGQPRYRHCRMSEEPAVYLEFPLTRTSVVSATVHLGVEGRYEEIVVPSPVPGSRETARVRLSLGKPESPGLARRLTLDDSDGEGAAFEIPRAADSFAVGLESIRSFLHDYDVEVAQSAWVFKTVTGIVREGSSMVYREGYGGRWRRAMPVQLAEFQTDFGALNRPVTIELADDPEVHRGTVRIEGDTVFLDETAVAK